MIEAIMNRIGALLLIPAFALIGAANQQREWLGAIVGGLIGLFFALLVMGLIPKWLTRIVTE